MGEFDISNTWYTQTMAEVKQGEDIGHMTKWIIQIEKAAAADPSPAPLILGRQ